MDALDILDIAAKVGGMVDLVLKQNSCHLVADEVGWLDRVVFAVEIVGLHGASLDAEHEVSAVDMSVYMPKYAQNITQKLTGQPCVCRQK